MVGLIQSHNIQRPVYFGCILHTNMLHFYEKIRIYEKMRIKFTLRYYP